MRLAKQAIGLLYASAMAGQTAPDLLSQIREKMAVNLDQVPNYTCTETIERSERRSADRRRINIALHLSLN